MNPVIVIESLTQANSLVMEARLASQQSGPVLDKLRRIATYLESQIAAELKAVEN